MRLITHNMLACHSRGCSSNNFPLKFEEAEVERVEADLNTDFLVNMLPRLHYPALVQTALQLGIIGLPDSLPDNATENDDFLKILHTVLLETRVQAGKMICPGCAHVYPIRDGIPNMLLAEHELP
ncbi:MAG: hypothetical protein BJ554DRAFT_5901 [Olpidium bornovanus]|uniref:Trm112p-domain-containing protein n=1 Tax=Olpidium bornovanus TaxID=278681 RepID=A0A8H7ZYT8_9FUNG|nr:MAG: hypothetical protein BJ554DRAFT_5901 [Olpidium bornovanus]